MGKTQLVLSIIGQMLDDDPAPMIYLGPTRNNVHGVIRPKLQHMLKSVPSLAKDLRQGRDANQMAPECKGVIVRLAWAGSATEVAAQNAVIGIADEIDRMEDLPGEGDPLRALGKRTESYANGKLISTSTPTLGSVETYIHEQTKMEHWAVSDGSYIYSRAWLEWQNGTRHEWAVPCLSCDEYFVPRFRHVHCKVDKGSILEQAQSARLCCPRCGYEHDDNDAVRVGQRGMPIAPGQWVENGELKGEPPESLTYSLWVSGLFSPNNSISGRMYDWLTAKQSDKPGQQQVEINTGFGELWAVMGDSPKWTVIQERESPYEKGTVPSKVNALFLTVDVQKNRLEYVIRGWGYQESSWLVDQGVLYGDTDDYEVWNALAELFESDIDGHRIDFAAVDARYRGSFVYEWVLRFPGQAFAVKGDTKSTQGTWYRQQGNEKNVRGRTNKSGSFGWLLNGSFMKSWVFDRLGLPHESPGAWHVYQDIEEDYCKQVTNEARIPKGNGEYNWVRTGENHKLDCEYMQVFLAMLKKSYYNYPSEGDETEPAKKPLRRRRRRARVIESESA